MHHDALWTLSLSRMPLEQVFLLGQAPTLLKGCAWEIMHKWVVANPPVTHVQIAHMNFVLVGSAEGVKRVFQTGKPLLAHAEAMGAQPPPKDYRSQVYV